MADQSSVTLQKQFIRRAKELNLAIGLSNSLVDKGNKMDSLVPKKKNSSRILGSAMIDLNQDHKRRCLEKLVICREPITQQNVEDVECALEIQVIDDTALIEATATVTRFKNRYRNENDLGSGKNQGNNGGSRNPNDENGDKKKNKAFKKQGKRCSMKCLNEKKPKTQVFEDIRTSEKQIPVGKGKKVCRKMSANVKYVYQKKYSKNQKLKVTGVEEHLKIENQNPPEKIVDESIQETDVSLKVSIENEKESTIKLAETDANLQVSIEKETESTITLAETDVNLKVSIGEEKEPTIESVETETVIEKDDGFIVYPQDDVLINNEAEDQNVNSNTNVGSKKTAYSKDEMESLRFVDEPGQKTKWSEVYGGFAPSVVREYNGLAIDTNNRLTQRYYRVVNCGSIRHGNAILGVPPVIPLSSPSGYRKFEPYDRVQGKVQLK